MRSRGPHATLLKQRDALLAAATRAHQLITTLPNQGLCLSGTEVFAKYEKAGNVLRAAIAACGGGSPEHTATPEEAKPIGGSNA